MGFYKDEILKNASARAIAAKVLTNQADNVAKNYDDVVKIMGRVVRQGDDASDIVRKSFNSAGTGSFIVDGLKGLATKATSRRPNALPKGLSRAQKKSLIASKPELYARTSKLGDKLDNIQHAYLKKINDADMKAGHFLGKNNNRFDDTIKIKFNNGAAGDAVQEISTKRVSAPVSKTVKKATPFLATMGASSILYPNQGENAPKGGGEI